MKESIVTRCINEVICRNGIYFSSSDSKDISFPKDAHEKLANFEDKSFWFKHRNEVIKDAILKYHVSGLFFDIGGGGGFVSKMLNQQEKVCSIVIEPILAGCLVAKNRGLQNIVCADLGSLNFKNKMKYVGAFDVIEHIADDIAFVRAVGNSMKKNGLMFATVPAFQFLYSKIDEESGHYRRYNLNNFSKLFEENGFKILHKSYFFTYLFPLMLFIKRKNSQHTESEHIMTGFRLKVIKSLNFFDKILRILFKGYFPGGSILIVAQKK